MTAGGGACVEDGMDHAGISMAPRRRQGGDEDQSADASEHRLALCDYVWNERGYKQK
jgi:hypothetical protein